MECSGNDRRLFLAWLARSGEVRELEINHEILDKAVKNTVDLIKSMIIIKDMK